MFRKIKRYLKDPYYALGYDMIQKCPHLMPDKFYLKVLWKQIMGYELDLNNPKTFNEKLQWLKLYNRNPLYTTLVDKYRVKQWVADKIGEQYIIPTLKVYQSVDEIDLDELPNQFVLKCNHDSGSVVICRDKSTFDLEAAKEKLNKGLHHNFYWDAREWPYKNVKRCIIAEKYLSTPNDDLYDYKFFCFSGVVKCFKIDYNRHTNHHANYYDREGHLLPFGETAYPSALTQKIEIPSNLSELIQKAEKLSKDSPFARVDFYNDNGQIQFGEITFYPSGGFGTFSQVDADDNLGRMINITTETAHSGGGQ